MVLQTMAYGVVSRLQTILILVLLRYMRCIMTAVLQLMEKFWIQYPYIVTTGNRSYGLIPEKPEVLDIETRITTTLLGEAGILFQILIIIQDCQMEDMLLLQLHKLLVGLRLLVHSRNLQQQLVLHHLLLHQLLL